MAAYFQPGSIVVQTAADQSEQYQLHTASHKATVLTADGKSYALVGFNTSSIDAHTVVDFQRLQRLEVQQFKHYLQTATLFEMQACGEVDDSEKEVLRCPRYSFSIGLLLV